MNKSVKGDTLPDISKVSASEGGKKTKVEGGIVKAGASKGDEFAEFSFKEGNTAVLKLQEIFVQEKGKDALKKLEAHQAAEAGAATTSATTTAQPKVKGGAKNKKKAVSKSAAKTVKSAKKADVSASVAKSVDKVLKYTPNKSSSRKETPQKTASVGKQSAAKRSTTGGKKQTPALPSPGGKQSTRTTDQMTMAQFKKYLEWHEKKKGGKASSGGKVLGKRSAAGKASTASGKASKRSKK